MNKLVIIDGNAIIHRAYHAIPPMHTKDGTMVNAVYGFVSMMLKVIKDIKPTHLAVTFDVAGGSTARLAKFKAYKATRVKADQALYDQIPLVHEATAGLGFPIYEVSGYEADDVIGTIVRSVRLQTLDSSQSPKSKVQSLESEIYIVTGDMDTLQLVASGVKVYTLRKGLSDVVIYDEMEVQKRWGFGPDKMIDYKALRGDASDNIPGVPGIGEKGATELITKFGSLDAVYSAIQSPESRVQSPIKPGIIKKLEAGKDSAYLSRELATIDCAVPGVNFVLADAQLKPFDSAKIAPLFQKFEFVSLLKRMALNDDSGLLTPDSRQRDKKSDRIGKKTTLDFTEITTLEAVRRVRVEIENTGAFSAQAIWSGPTLQEGKFSALVIVAGAKGFKITPEHWEELLPIFENKNLVLTGHNLKPLIKVLRYHKKIIVANKLFDVMIASYLLNPGSRAHDAGSILLKELGHTTASAAGQNSLFGVDARAAAEELFLLAKASITLRKNLESADNAGLFAKVEMPLINVLAEMELNGIAVDPIKLRELAEYVYSEIKTITAKIYDLAGQEFNIASPLQLREILFEKLDIPVAGIKKGKTGLSTSAEELQKMKGLHPIIDEIETYRELAKLENTYIGVLPALINPITKRIHTTFNQAVAATGRLSSSDPNLQNIPIRTELGREIRRAFIAAPGKVLVSADYSQIELRIVASLAEDKKMMEIFEGGQDIHSATAAAINEVPLERVTKEMRRAAKEINFGILYGMGTYGLAWRAEIPAATAKAFIAKYFSEFSGVKKYLDSTIALAKTTGYTETLFGRRRYLPDLNATNFQARASAERMAVNHPIQGTAADLMKMAMIKVSENIEHRISNIEYKDEVKMLLQVHDELIIEALPEDVKVLQNLLKTTMEGVVKLRVPVLVQVSAGSNWGEME